MAGASMPMVIPSVPELVKVLERATESGLRCLCPGLRISRCVGTGGRITSNVARLKNCHSPRICHPIQLGVSPT